MKKQSIIKAGVLFALLLSLNQASFAQDAVAMLKFEDAERAYNAGDYPKVLESLDEVEEMVGVTSKTLYLRIVSQNELFAGGRDLYDGPEEFQFLSKLREHTSTYLEAMGSQGLDDKYRTVYRIQESLEEYPETEEEWRIAFEEEEAKKIRKEYHDNGQLKSIGKVEGGMKTGEWKNYHGNGELASSGFYKNDKQQGSWKYYNDLGVFIMSHTYSPDGGYSRKMFFGNGQPQLIDRFNAEGHLEGPYEEFYENGQIRVKGTYLGKYSLRTGQYVSYHENGQIWVQAKYSDQGQVIGEYIEYHDNGQVAAEGVYKVYESGILSGKSGQWIFYHDNGEIRKIENYSKPDRIEGEVKEYFKSGKIKSVVQYENGKRVQFHEYYESGQLAFKSDRLEEGYDLKYYHENGQLKELGRYYDHDSKIKHGDWKSYYDNGQVAKIENYWVGHLDDKWESYYMNGQVKEKGKYKKGGKKGKWVAYYENGQVKEEGKYEAYKMLYGNYESHKISTWTYYHPNGEVKAKGEYEKGEKVGKWEYYDEQGNRTSN